MFWMVFGGMASQCGQKLQKPWYCAIPPDLLSYKRLVSPLKWSWWVDFSLVMLSLEFLAQLPILQLALACPCYRKKQSCTHKLSLP